MRNGAFAFRPFAPIRLQISFVDESCFLHADPFVGTAYRDRTCISASTVQRSPIELRRHGIGGRDRTADARLMRPQLYQLSYTDMTWQARQGSNLRMRESKSRALPLGDAPLKDQTDAHCSMVTRKPLVVGISTAALPLAPDL